MRILFVVSELSFCFSGTGAAAVREYVRELRKYADVVCVYLSLSGGKIPFLNDTADYVFKRNSVQDLSSSDSRIFETALYFRTKMDFLFRDFKPDVIHCVDRKAYIPFCFEKNVFYASHFEFSDLPGNSAFDELYFDELKLERRALEKSQVLAVYSDYAASRIMKFTCGKTSPVVLPPGVVCSKVIKNKEKTPAEKKLCVAQSAVYAENMSGSKMRVCCIVRSGNAGVLSGFADAVNKNGVAFKLNFNVEYTAFCCGRIMPGIDISLFDRIETEFSGDLYGEFRNSDIVVFLGHDDSGGFPVLEAMSEGCLVALSECPETEMYAEPGLNCLAFPRETVSAAAFLKDSVENFRRYRMIRDNAVRTAVRYSWNKSALAHLFIYRQMCRNRVSLLDSAFGIRERNLIERYRKSGDVEKALCSEAERKISNVIVSALQETMNDIRILVLTGVYSPLKSELPESVEIFSVLNEGEDGLVVRPECLPFDDMEFDFVVSAGCWESVLEPCGAIVELQRVCAGKIFVLYNKGRPYAWQTFSMECFDDWRRISAKDWNVRTGGDYSPLFEDSGFEVIEYARIP